MVEAIEQEGGQLRYAHRALGLWREAGRWIVTTNRGDVRAKTVVANTLPGDLLRMWDDVPPAVRSGLQSRQQQVETGWGAAMLYRQLEGDAPVGPAAGHRQLLGSSLVDGHSVFLSWSAASEPRSADGARTLVASTHVPMPAGHEGLSASDVDGVQDRMRATLAALAPDLDGATMAEWTASPRTFARFTRRSSGHVGGVPRRAGLGNYGTLWPRPVADGVWLVGDSGLFGQSLLATAVGGSRVAASIP
jgi:phytoene dehydrogenase-like protein